MAEVHEVRTTQIHDGSGYLVGENSQDEEIVGKWEERERRTVKALQDAIQAAGLPAPAVFQVRRGEVQLEWASPQVVCNIEVIANEPLSLMHLTVDPRRVCELDTNDVAEAVAWLQAKVLPGQPGV